MISAIIQARMSSTRLPEKIMLKVCDKTVLEHIILRIQKSKKIDKILIATTTNKTDDVIENFCKEKQIECFRGSEDDVLSRYKFANDYLNSDIVVRICSDCPLLDSNIIDDVINTFQNGNYDYVNNLMPLPRTYPDGLLVEVFSSKVLNEAYVEAKKPSDREHVTLFMWNRPKRYNIFRLDYKEDFSKYRFNLDYPEDFTVIKAIYESLYPDNPDFVMSDVITWLNNHPEIMKINSHIESNQGWESAFKKDRELGFTN
jgi:spore coat polysaccharide biosynthesis protein SpsF